MAEAADLLPVARAEEWLRGRIPGFSRIHAAQKTATGQSNPTFILETDAGRLVLRRKPPGRLLKSAHAVEREYRVLSALHGRGVPVPKPWCLCEDEAVLGTAFFVMEHVAGRCENDPRAPGLSRWTRAALYDDMNRCLAALHALDPDAIGLSDFGRPGDYFARQLSRWTAQYRASQTEPQPQMEALIDWLGAHLPPEDGMVALVHGDWRLDNLLFDPASGRITAVLDWELSTLGHPLADLGAQIMQWQMPVGPDSRGLDGVDREASGIPSDAAYVARYAERRGWRAPPDMRFPVAFAFFRMAAILQGVRKRALDGNASNPEKALRMGAYGPEFARRATRWISAGS
ncbi:phosphotransferase family protein [Halovulum dunhuangense]|uniref:Phosphotransferase family protein n=1 Tax=Halovulum dunhuangense TaxID=1505036 RepID=A0A849L2Z3_9RHOB|nr:phosphotransferase family protein [Halovulum dunhuangense]NNU80604.1 phosphotransferase family protein [Halovulum dunhuangense]